LKLPGGGKNGRARFQPPGCSVEGLSGMKSAEMDKPEETFRRFVEIVKALRNPDGGCPWDLEQNHQTLRPYLIEESYEVLEAIDRADDRELKEELGDLLLQVVLHAQVATDRKAFDITDVINAIADKMVRRHPHVFGSTSVAGSSEVLKNWELIKTEERNKKESGKKASLLDGVPAALPALLRAQRIGEKASRVSFDWDNAENVWAKVQEELSELREAIDALGEKVEKAQTTAPPSRALEKQRHLESELGDVLFSLCQLGRWLGASAEDCLRGTIERFLSRFQRMEATADKPLSELSIDELEERWQQAKRDLSE